MRKDSYKTERYVKDINLYIESKDNLTAISNVEGFDFVDWAGQG